MHTTTVSLLLMSLSFAARVRTLRSKGQMWEGGRAALREGERHIGCLVVGM